MTQGKKRSAYTFFSKEKKKPTLFIYCEVVFATPQSIKESLRNCLYLKAGKKKVKICLI